MSKTVVYKSLKITRKRWLNRNLEILSKNLRFGGKRAFQECLCCAYYDGYMAGRRSGLRDRAGKEQG